MHNLTIHYFRRDNDSPRRVELPGIGVVPATLALTVECYGPRTQTTRMGLVHRSI